MEFMALAIGLILQERENKYRNRYFHKPLRDAENVFEMDDVLFKQNFRLSKDLVKRLIDDLTPFAKMRTLQGIPFHLQVFAALRFFGNKTYQGSVGNSCLSRMSQPSVSRSIRAVTNLILQHITPLHVKFPTTQQMRDEKKKKFLDNYHLNDIIGCVDCSHIRILAPPAEHPELPADLYLNHKNFHSINLEIICDADEMVLSANARFPGSTHNSTIWDDSPIRKLLIENHKNDESYLLGHSGYPLEPWLLTPFKEPNSIPEKKFNILHEEAQSVVRKTFVLIRKRFKCLSRDRKLHYDPAVAAKIIYAVLTLHNMCTAVNLPYDDDEEEADNDEYDADEIEDLQDYEEQTGIESRAAYVLKYMQ